MDTLPYDILRLFSLYLEPLKLAVCWELLNMYNDNWYFDKLTLLYPGYNLYTVNDYKDLYRKSLINGTIYYDSINIFGAIKIDQLKNLKYEKSYITKGIHAVHISNINHTYILNFNGDVYLEHENTVKLIDTKVIGLNKNIYIKQDEIYYRNDNTWTRLNINTYELIKVVNSKYILSTDGVYIIISHNSWGFYPLKECIDIEYINNSIYIVTKNNITYCLDNKSTSIFVITNIILKPNVGVFDNNGNILIGSYQNMISSCKFEGKVNKISIMFTSPYILSNNILYLLHKYFDKIEILSTINNVKHVFGDDTITNNICYRYIIKY